MADNDVAAARVLASTTTCAVCSKRVQRRKHSAAQVICRACREASTARAICLTCLAIFPATGDRADSKFCGRSCYVAFVARRAGKVRS
jgi:hypothetical protein